VSGAVLSYTESLRHARWPATVFNIAQCHRQLQHYRKAIFFYGLFLSEWERVYPGKVLANRAKVNIHIENMKAKLAEAKAAEKRRQAEAKRETMKMPSSAPTRFSGKLRLLGIQGKRPIVFINGKREMKAIGQDLSLAAGRHQIWIRDKDYLRWSTEVVILPGETTTTNVTQKPVPKRKVGWLIGSIAGGVVAVGGIAIAMVYHNLAGDHIRGTRSEKADINVMTGGFVVAAAALTASAAGLYFYLTGDRRPKSLEKAKRAAMKPKMRLRSLSLVPTSNGAFAGGSFSF
jgi:hypothetical protein